MSEPNTRDSSRIILALDVPTVEEARKVMEQVVDQIRWVKVGLELITAQLAGEVVAVARSLGFETFWDGKPKDVPRTVAAAVREAAKHGAKFINVHADSGVEALLAAVANKGDADLLAVSELTSHDTENVELDHGASRNAKVLYLARMAAYTRCDGLICSPKELAFLARYSGRKEHPEVQLGNLIKVIPGTRSPGAEHQDQKNVETQEVAIENGADWLVIGNEILRNPKLPPRDAAEALNVRIAQAIEFGKGGQS